MRKDVLNKQSMKKTQIVR